MLARMINNYPNEILVAFDGSDQPRAVLKFGIVKTFLMSLWVMIVKFEKHQSPCLMHDTGINYCIHISPLDLILKLFDHLVLFQIHSFYL